MIVIRFLFLLCAAMMFATYLLYEDRDRQIQSTLETWWIKLDDRRKESLSRHTTFMRAVAETCTDILDRLFGKRLYSFRAVCVSACYSYASVLLSVVILTRVLSVQLPINNLVLIASFLILITLGTLPAFIRRRSSLKFWKVGATVFVICSTGLLTGVGFLLSLYLGLLLGILSDFLFIGFTRRLLRWSLGLKSFLQIAGVIFLNIIAALFLIYAPYQLGVYLMVTKDSYPTLSKLADHGFDLTYFVGITAWSNVIDALAATLFIILALIMLGHRIFWPLLQRPIYALQRLGIAERKKRFAVLGLILAGIGLGAEPEWLKTLIEKLMP